MNRDPFYRKIVEALCGPVDPELFEQCAADILRALYPTLVPIRGGVDGGMDGEIGDLDGNGFIVSTTRRDVIGNVTQSLKQQSKGEHVRRHVVVATSQHLPQPRRARIERRVGELGFHLRQIHDRASFADHLYGNPKWCKELLNLTGQREPLSVVPLTARPRPTTNVFGRGPDLEWLGGTVGDRVLVGQPGSGKTELMRWIMTSKRWYFLVSDNVDSVAPAVREIKPAVIVVDDSHVRIGVLKQLRQLRESIEGDFAIVATCWPGSAALVQQTMLLPAEAVRTLAPLRSEDIVKVIDDVLRQLDMTFSRALLREIVAQARGRPGLATTLAYLTAVGDVSSAVSGELLVRETKGIFSSLVGHQATDVLACFAVGGAVGMTMKAVGGAVGLNTLEIRRMLVDLASGGVVEEREDAMVVEPGALRHALVGEVFFGGAASLPINSLLPLARQQDEALLTLIGARLRGANVPDELLLSLLMVSRSLTAWSGYARTGAEQARFVWNSYPFSPLEVAGDVLDQVPEEVVPILLLAGRDETSEPHNNPRHPLRILYDWVKRARPDASDAVERRRLLLECLRPVGQQQGTSGVVLRTIPVVLSFDYWNTDESLGGDGVVVEWTFLSERNVEEVTSLWPLAREILTSTEIADWRHVQELIDEWLHPEQPQMQMPDSVRELASSFAKQVIADVVEMAAGRQGILLWLKRKTRRFAGEISIPVDEDFEVLYPEYRSPETRFKAPERLRPLVPRWMDMEVSDAAATLANYSDEAHSAGLNFPVLLPMFCGLLAKSVSDPSEWVRQLQAHGATYDLIQPFQSELSGGARE